MAGTMLVKDAAVLWGITDRAVTMLCKNGKIPGAHKENGVWVIPSDAKRPADRRRRSGLPSYKPRPADLPLPIGISDYRLASSEYYYVDKTLMIRDFLDERPMVSLFTRPRRFGKTLNMDMLRVFFEKTEEDTSVYFRDKRIWQCGERYQTYQGQYPVIFLSFKDVKCSTWEETFTKICKLISMEFQRHIELETSSLLNDYDKEQFRLLAEGRADETTYQMSLQILSLLLHKHYQQKAIIIIDEYDTPIQQGHLIGFYDSIVTFMRNFFSGGLKDNPNLAYGFLTGILRVAKESIFSGLNNLAVNSVLDKKYSEYFGFTKDEVGEMAVYYGAVNKLNEICEWYDGYRFGNTEIFNPWSVINYFSSDCEPRAYWLSTSNNDIIGEILAQADRDIYEQLAKLLQGKSLLTYIDTSVIYPQIQNNPSSIYSFLLVSGYLKVSGNSQPFGAGSMCEVSLPNKEILFVYQSEILEQLAPLIPQASAIGVQEAVYTGNAGALKERLSTLLKTSISFYDTAKESFYHGLMLGLLAMTDDKYQESSNDESGDGRYDICLTPKQANLPGVIIELKAAKKCSSEELKQLADRALQQIEEKHYDAQLRQAGVTEIIKYGVAFSGKNVEITSM